MDAPRPSFIANSYAGMNDLIGRALNQFPINAAARAFGLQRAIAQSPIGPTMANDPRNTPSRSQYSQGYTAPFQYFASSNTWQTPSGQQSRGRRAVQPSTKFAGPRAPIPTAMPWG